MKNVSIEQFIESVAQALEKRNLVRSAQVDYARNINRIEPYGFEIDLSTERTPDLGNGLRVPAHHSFRTFDGTDETVNITVVYDENVSGKKQDIMYDNDSYDSDEMFSGCTIYNSAQSGKVLSFRAYRGMSFKNGSTKFRGTVSVNNPTTIAVSAQATTATTVITLAGATTIKKRTIQNKSGGSVFVGSVNTVTNAGATKGLEILDGEAWETENQDDIYIYPTATKALDGLILVQET